MAKNKNKKNSEPKPSKVEVDSKTNTKEKIDDINKYFEFTYISHCQKCTIKQNELLYIFLLKDKHEL